jgi:hypothetical protein
MDRPEAFLEPSCRVNGLHHLMCHGMIVVKTGDRDGLWLGISLCTCCTRMISNRSLEIIESVTVMLYHLSLYCWYGGIDWTSYVE